MRFRLTDSGPAVSSRITAPALPDRRPAVEPDGATTTSSLTLATTAAACGSARRWVALELARFGIDSPDMRGDVELVVSELVSNAVRHGASPVVVTLTHAASELRVSVTDGGRSPHGFDRLLHDPAAPRGRGLAIVALLAASWGVWTQEPGPGKTVWCRLGASGSDPER